MNVQQLATTEYTPLEELRPHFGSEYLGVRSRIVFLKGGERPGKKLLKDKHNVTTTGRGGKVRGTKACTLDLGSFLAVRTMHGFDFIPSHLATLSYTYLIFDMRRKVVLKSLIPTAVLN